MMRVPWRLLSFLACAALILTPALDAGHAPGAPRTDVEDGLAAALRLQRAWRDGSAAWHTTLLNHPDGGILLPADPLGAVFIAAFEPVLGLARAATALCGLQLAMSGWMVHRFAVERAAAVGRAGPRTQRGAFAAGLSYMTCGTLLSTVHNGNWEGLAGGAPAWAAWAAWRLARRGRLFDVLSCALALAWSALQGPYIAALALGFALTMLWGGPAPRVRRALAIALGLVLAAPWAWAAHAGAVHPDALVRIKGAAQLASMRRTIGPLDLQTLWMPGDFRAPDIARLGRAAEGFLHCGYLGLVTLGAALVAPRAPGDRRLWLAGAGALICALGPVLVGNARPVWVDGRAIPLPYALLEPLVGFSSLSLLWQLALGVSLMLALRVGALRLGFGKATLLVVALAAEAGFANPAGRAQQAIDVRPPDAVRALRSAAPGAVVVGPAGAGGPWLLHAAQHGKATAASLNFAANDASERLLGHLEGRGRAGAVDLRAGAEACAQLRAAAQAARVRYVLIYPMPLITPDPRDARLARAAACGRLMVPAVGQDPGLWALW